MSNHNLPIRDAVNASLDSVETALARLLESVASYNPSPEAASVLVQADEALTDTLDTLEYHQSSHNRILDLRSTTAELDQQLTDLLEALSETREETLKCSGTTFENNPRDVPYTELLDYASKISKFSQPPNPTTFRKQVLSLRSAALASQTAGQPPDPNAPPAEQAKEKLPLGLTAEDALLVDPFSGQQFAPWPSEQEMKLGALVTLQNGQMPWDMVSDEERKRAEREREREERRARGEYVPENEDEEGDKKEERRSVVAVGGVPRMGSGAAGGEAKEKINLSLDLYDPDDED